MCSRLLITFLLFTMGGCNPSSDTLPASVNATHSFEDIHTTRTAIQSHQGSAKDFTLLMPDSMNDESGVNMTIITDAILDRGWFPNGYT